MLTIIARIEDETKKRFRNMAKARGLSESELLRAVLQAATGTDKDDEQPTQPDPDNAEVDRMTVRMPRFLLQAVKARAKRKGMAPSRWITALVQSNLTGNPVMSDTEVAVLQACARELVATGRNINQIAYAINLANTINPGSFEKSWLPLEKLEEVKIVVDKNREEIRVFVRASQSVWEAN